MENKHDNPGIYLPPPFLYAAFFFAAILLQKILPLGSDFFHTGASMILAAVFLLAGMAFVFPALWQFFRTKNAVITVKPAHSLQTTGIYAISRNPMYLSLFLFYTGFSLMFGNWWNLILIPPMYLLLMKYLISREEKYLERKFGQQYADYKAKVHRWI